MLNAVDIDAPPPKPLWERALRRDSPFYIYLALETQPYHSLRIPFQEFVGLHA